MLTKHEDLIHDLAYDFYGKRLATCSSDQRIKVWDLDDVNGWVCTHQWKAHSGPIWHVDWAAPEFGQVIASCSSDRTVCVWEESEGSYFELVTRLMLERRNEILILSVTYDTNLFSSQLQVIMARSGS